jgi:hypothetical protein
MFGTFASTGTDLSVFDGLDANGVWRLLAIDRALNLSPFEIERGWTLAIETGPSAMTISGDLNLSTTQPVSPPFRFNIAGLSGTVAAVDLTLSGLVHGRPF